MEGADGTGTPGGQGAQSTVTGSGFISVDDFNRWRSSADQRVSAIARKQKEAEEQVFSYENRIRELEEELEDNRRGGNNYDLNGNLVTDQRQGRDARKVQRELEELASEREYYKKYAQMQADVTYACAKNGIVPGDQNVDWAADESDPDKIKTRILSSIPAAVRARDQAIARAREAASHDAVKRMAAQTSQQLQEGVQVNSSPTGLLAPGGFVERYKRYLQGDKTAISRGEIEATFKQMKRQDKDGNSVFDLNSL